MQQHGVEGKAVLQDHWWDLEHPEINPVVGPLLRLCLWALEVKNLAALGVWAGSAWFEVQGVCMDTGKSSKEAFQWHHEPGKAVSSVLET